MGIAGLLPQLKCIQQPVTLHRYRSQTLAIDGYAWLHRSAHSCAMELGMGQPTEKYLQFFIKRLTMLRDQYEIEPYLVFDGAGIKVKAGTEAKRHEKRAENRARAIELWEKGERRKSVEYFQKCVEITPEMTKVIIDYCIDAGFKYVVAPYEADPQLVYLEKSGLVQGVISEDSDLLVFGCRRLITKLNDFGEGFEICRDDFVHLPDKFPLNSLGEGGIRTMVCLAGCDYTKGIPQVGLLTAVKLVLKHKTMDQILLTIKREGKWKVPAEFFDEYRFADLAFQFQRVYCPLQNQLTTLNVVPNTMRDDPLLYESIGHAVHKVTGERCIISDETMIDHEIHTRIAIGHLDPCNHKQALINRERQLSVGKETVPSKIPVVSRAPITARPMATYWKSKPTTAEPKQQLRASAGGVGVMERIERIVQKRKLADSCQGQLNESSFFVRRQSSGGSQGKLVKDNDRYSDDNGSTQKSITSSQGLTLPMTPADSADSGGIMSCFTKTPEKENAPPLRDELGSIIDEHTAAEEVTEVLDELDDSYNNHQSSPSPLQQVTLTKGLAAKFTYRSDNTFEKRRRVPLTDCDVNDRYIDTKRLVIGKLNKRMLASTKDVGSVDIAQEKPSPSPGRTKPASQRQPSVSRHTVSSGTRQLSLSNFLYKG
ncbi:AaceriAER387Cp [[Ashbya] aceris (nom. inval.)]|nr:AaceriAER387Cp [[Ashbya] aceris (nom. inval.)]